LVFSSKKIQTSSKEQLKNNFDSLMASLLQKYFFPIQFGALLLLSLSWACQNQKQAKDIDADEDPLGAIEAMVNETNALSESEATQVDKKTLQALESLRDISFAPGTAGEKLYQAIRAGKDLKLEVFIFSTLEFEAGKAEVLPAMELELKQVAQILRAFPHLKLEISAHTEGVGDHLFNLSLSHDRATAVVATLSKMGLAPSQMKALGYGDEYPVADSRQPEGRVANQRVELSFE
jgi:outer membrane protein OmpA-like peptidoglycan-associated protein